MTKSQPDTTGPSFAGLVITEVLIVAAIFVGAIILVRLNTITLEDLQSIFG